MSTLKVNTILSETPTVNITDGLNVTGVSTVTTLNTTNIVNSTSLSNRNLIINGAMQVAQRGTSSTTSGYGSVDRFSTQNTGVDEAPTHAQVDVASGTTPYTSGFRKALKITNGNQTSGAGAADYIKFTTKLEAQDIASSGWNYVSSSSNITLSYWVRSSVAQTFFVRVTSIDSPVYNFPFSYAVSANTWTKVTKTIPGNSNLVFNNDNGTGLDIEWTLFRGTDTTGSGATLDTWAAYDSSQRQPDNTSTWYTTNDATWEITGVQLEVGSVATPFEHKTYAQELNACMRYYEGVYMGQGTALFRTYTNTAGSPSNCSNVDYNFKVEKRAQPTWAVEGNAQWAPANSTTAMSAYPSKSTCMFQRNDTSHQFLSDANGDLCGSFEAEI